MGPVSRASLVAENRLGLWSSALTDSPGSPSPSSQAEQHTGGAGTALGPPWSGWSMRWRELTVHPVAAGVLCAHAGQSCCQVGTGACPGDRMGPQEARIPTPHLPARLQIMACGCWHLPGLGGCVQHQPPCTRSAETPSSEATHHPCHHPGHPTSVREGLCGAVGDG